MCSEKTLSQRTLTFNFPLYINNITVQKRLEINHTYLKKEDN